MATDAYAQRVVHRRRPSEYIAPVIGLTLVGFVVAWLVVNAIQAPEQFFRVFLIGVTNGALYALVALGYTLVYGILELINFAHGDVFMLGGMLVATMTSAWFATATGAGLWGGIFLMNEEEIRAIVNGLFIGNKLARGEIVSSEGGSPP